MDEICPQNRSYTSLLTTNYLFLDICNDQHIFTILFQFIGYPAFVQLSSTSSQVFSAISKHEHIQAAVLKLKIKKLKERQYQRQFPNYMKIDFKLFNPYLLPPYEADLQIQSVISLEEREKQASMIEFRKLRENDVSKVNDWSKWRADKRVQSLLGLSKPVKQQKQEVKIHQILPSQPALQNEPSMQQKLRKIQQAQQMLGMKNQLQKKMIQEYPKTTNKVQQMRNKHFAQSIIGSPKLLLKHKTKSDPRPSSSSSQKYKQKQKRREKQQTIQKQEIRQKLSRAVPQNFKLGKNDLFSVRVKQLMIIEVQEHRKKMKQNENVFLKGVNGVLEFSGLKNMFKMNMNMNMKC